MAKEPAKVGPINWSVLSSASHDLLETNGYSHTRHDVSGIGILNYAMKEGKSWLVLNSRQVKSLEAFPGTAIGGTDAETYLRLCDRIQLGSMTLTRINERKVSG